jgi:50S ribosomal protein L16 3-hydroxylase
MILDTFPSPEEFYRTYWCKKPFIVRGYIPSDVIDTLVDGDTLAGLSLEEDIKSRFITNDENGKGWHCDHGPLDDDHFNDVGDRNWSLLVQNVEQHHTDTAKLLTYFQFSPRWLLDDVMVSFSATGGSVGPHTDSYHTFLVQGIGKRAWKISENKITDDSYVDNPDMKILENGFVGETFEVTAGDVIYMPPFFGHEGKTLDAAMTFSVGFQGPKLSEMMGDYAQYLDENDHLNKRFLGEDLNEDSAGFSIASATQKSIQNDIVSVVESDDFALWMATYFAMPTHDEIEEEGIELNDIISSDDLRTALESGKILSRPEHIKLAITQSSKSGVYLSANNEVIHSPKAQNELIKTLNLNHEISLKNLNDFDEAIEFLTTLYNLNMVLSD